MNFISPNSNGNTDSGSNARDKYSPPKQEQVRPEDRGYTSPAVDRLNSIKPKSIRDINSLSKGDRIVDYNDNERYVVGVVGNKILMTGKNKNLGNMKKVYTWNNDKFQQAVDERGFTLDR